MFSRGKVKALTLSLALGRTESAKVEIERITNVHRTVTPIQGQLACWRHFRQGY